MKLNTNLRVWTPLLLVVMFLLTRCVTYLLWLRPDVNFVANDVSYYGFHLHRLEHGEPDVMQEYPPPAVWILHLLYRLGGGWQSWLPLFAGCMLLLDALVAFCLYRTQGARAALFWMLFTAANGAIVWFRFDLIPAALVAFACLLLTTRPWWSGAFVGMGAAIKLWPALLILPMLAPDPRSGEGPRRLFGFLIVGGGLGAVSLLVEGWHRNVAPLSWQRERGLQIESVPATPLMAVRTFTDSPHWTLELSQYNAIELFGPGVSAMLVVASVCTTLATLFAIYLAMRLIRRRADATAILLAIFTVILATVVANKTLSPQYVLWLGGPIAVLIGHDTSAWLRRHIHVLATGLVTVGVLTQITYPWATMGIMASPLGSGPETSVLVLRNLLLIVMLVHAAWLTLKASPRRVPHEGEQLAKL
uniref:glycosyltransferase family 87 protein n=1 Tax=Tessaracoccus timonensis TaxID=2161816 RepID=UPI00131EDA7F|nr:glycosyltransferase family 87 protein [Tessaracoccus timonensis]